MSLTFSHTDRAIAPIVTDTSPTGQYFPARVDSTTNALNPSAEIAAAIIPFSDLDPAEKITWLYRNAKLRLAFLILGLIAGMDLVLMSIINLWPYLLKMLSINAMAASDESAPPIENWPMFQWYIGGLLGLMLVTGLLVWPYLNSKLTLALAKR
jgi:hypothetical protein